MDDYPSNSNSRPNRPERVRTEEPKGPSDKKVKRVVQGEVVRRKRPLGKRFKETFIGGDTKGSWGSAFLDVVIPATRDMIAEFTQQGIERMIFGESSSRRGRSRGPGGYVAYNRISSSGTRSSIWDRGGRDEPRQDISRRARSQHDFDEIVLNSRAEGEEVVDRLFDLVSQYDMASIADLYELVGVQSNFTDQKWGWTDLRGAGVSRVRGGYVLALPKPEPLS